MGKWCVVETWETNEKTGKTTHETSKENSDSIEFKKDGTCIIYSGASSIIGDYSFNDYLKKLIVTPRGESSSVVVDVDFVSRKEMMWEEQSGVWKTIYRLKKIK